MEPGLSLAELVGSLALATDLALGHPLEQGLGACVVATRLAELADLPPDELRRTFYVALLRHIGCTTENDSLAGLVGGDEVELSAQLNALSGGTGPQYLGAFLRYATQGRPVLEKVRATGRVVAGLRAFGAANQAICEVARTLAGRLGFDPDTVHAVGTVYERFDGKGMPNRLRGGQIPMPVRLAPGAGPAAALHDLGPAGGGEGGRGPARGASPGRPPAGEWEAVRLHPYQTGGVLGRAPSLARLAAIASLHHERLDGSGYIRGASAAQLAPAARILAAADAYHAMREPRPHREPLTPERATAALDTDVRAGRLDRDGVDAVLAAAGHRVGRRKRYPGGLTAREVEAPRLLPRGGPTPDIPRTPSTPPH